MHVNRKELIDTLKKIQPALSTKGIVEEMNCFMFKDGMVYGYNDRLCIGHRSSISLSGCSVPAVEFVRIIQGMTDASIDIEHNDEKQLLNISGKSVQAKLKTIRSALIESIPDATKNKWTALPGGFMEGVDLCLFSASKEPSVAFLNCLNISGSTVVSSDNFRISRYEMQEEIGVAFLLPLTAAIELSSIGGFDQYAVNSGWVFFRTAKEDIIFCARLVEAEYPDVAALFDIPEEDTFELPASIKDGIAVCDVLSDMEAIDKRIQLTLAGTSVICKGEGSKGWVEHRVDGVAVPDGLTFDVNPVFLAHVIDRSTSAQVANGKLIFRSGNFTHIMALPE
jgi:DNA polymerase III sliding clamp (beta) subunit (PCNA family)